MNTKDGFLIKLLWGVILTLIFVSGCSQSNSYMSFPPAAYPDIQETHVCLERHEGDSIGLYYPLGVGDDLGIKLIAHHPVLMAQRKNRLHLAQVESMGRY
jgi:hypothetical protein